jgi:DNA modification methylase
MTLAVEYLKITELKNYERNARTHSPEQIQQVAASIQEFGFTNPVLVDENNILIAGHGRTAAANSLGMDTVPVIRLSSLSESQKKALRIADNQLALNAGWDFEMLAAELQELELEEYSLDLLGFDDEFMEGLLDGSLLEDEGEQDDPAEDTEAPEPPEQPITVMGDLWVLGSHRLMCGDSTSIESVEHLADGDLIDLLLTDPPYNVAYEGKTADALTIQNDSMTDGEFRQFLRDVYSAADAVMRPGAVFYIWHADSEGYNFRGAAHDVGWQVRQCLIWNKNSMVMSRQDYHWKHEPCLYGWKSGAAHYWGSDRKQTTVLEFNRPTRNGVHPTMKPVDLMEYQIKNSSKRGQNVMDLFGGSGSTLIACENANRKARLMELDPKYCDVIVKRWQEHAGKEAILESTGQTFAELEAIRKPETVQGGGMIRANFNREAANDAVFYQKRRA